MFNEYHTQCGNISQVKNPEIFSAADLPGLADDCRSLTTDLHPQIAQISQIQKGIAV